MDTVKTFTEIGCILDESAGSSDDINLRTIDFAEDYGFEYEPLPNEEDEDYGQILSETADDAVSYLNDNVEGLPYCSFYFEDNSLFYAPCIENAKEDCAFVSWSSLGDARHANVETDPDDPAYPPNDYEGEWLHVNDHGNCTLYVRTKGEDKEVWGIV